jgi:hypothetical protein
MSGQNDSDDRFVELVQAPNSTEADLLAMYLTNCEIEFQMLGHSSAPVQAGLVPEARRPVTFRVRLKDLVQARKLVEEYDKMQSAPSPSADED